MVVCISLHSENMRQRDIYKALLECCLQCVEMQSPLIERSLKGLIDCLYRLSPDLFRTTLSQCPTSRRMQFTQFVERERIDINLSSPAKLNSSPNVSPSIQSRIVLTKPGVTDESSYVSEVCSESSQLLSEEWSVTVTKYFSLLTRRLISYWSLFNKVRVFLYLSIKNVSVVLNEQLEYGIIFIVDCLSFSLLLLGSSSLTNRSTMFDETDCKWDWNYLSERRNLSSVICMSCMTIQL